MFADTPLLLAIGSHQERVVKELLSKNPEQAIVPNLQGELPLARCFSRATHSSLASDLEILKDLMAKLDGDLLNVRIGLLVCWPLCNNLLALCVGCMEVSDRA